jgi:hypothetical protein
MIFFSIPAAAYPTAAYGQFAQALGQAAQLLPSGTQQREGEDSKRFSSKYGHRFLMTMNRIAYGNGWPWTP